MWNNQKQKKAERMSEASKRIYLVIYLPKAALALPVSKSVFREI
jgi:hypothetical protein